jgi:hypothetical protein
MSSYPFEEALYEPVDTDCYHNHYKYEYCCAEQSGDLRVEVELFGKEQLYPFFNICHIQVRFPHNLNICANSGSILRKSSLVLAKESL